MSKWIEVEVVYEDESRPKTKKELKESVATGKKMYFQAVSPFDTYSELTSTLAPGDRLIVAGPNPWTDRRWYAQVIVSDIGVARVK